MSADDEILLDAIMTRHGYTRAEAEEAARYVEHLRHVRMLLESRQIEHNDLSEWATCRGCDAVSGEVDGEAHAPDCPVFLAWVDLGHPLADAAMGYAFGIGLAQSPFRVPGYVRRETSTAFAIGLAEREVADTDAPVSFGRLPRLP